MNNLHIVTVATSSKYYFPYLKESCKNNGKDLEVLGFGEKWQGFSWRFLLMMNYLKSLNPDDIVCFVDGYDVICLRNLNNLKEEFLKIKSREKCKLIIGMEIHGTIMNKIGSILLFGKCKDLAINAGTYIGYVKDVYEILNNTYNLNPDTKADDQLMLTTYCNMSENDIYIDKNSELFLTIVNELNEIDEFIKIDKNEVIYKETKPFFIHGPSNTYLDNLIIKLGYNYDYKNKIKDLLLKDQSSKKFGQFINHIYQHKELIIIIILVLISYFFYLYKNNSKNINYNNIY